MEQLSRLGVGLAWLGRPWPPNSPDYTTPADEEIDRYLSQAFDLLSEHKSQQPPSSATNSTTKLLMLDTATAYGAEGEARLAQFFSRHPMRRDQCLLATKWGGSYEREVAGQQAYIMTLAQLQADVEHSLALFGGKIDWLYAHLPSSVDEDQCLQCLTDPSISQYLAALKASGKVGKIGASISAANVLRSSLDQGLLDNLDILQLPARISASEPQLWRDLCQRLQYNGSVTFVLNSPVRGRELSSAEQNFAAAAQHCFQLPRCMLLTGTRTHLPDTVALWNKLSAASTRS